MSKRKGIIDQLRQAARDSSMSQNDLAHATGLDKGAVSRFVSGKRGLSMESLDAIADVLKLRIVSDRKTKG